MSETALRSSLPGNGSETVVQSPATPWAEALNRAAITYKGALALEGEARLAAFRDVRMLLDGIVADYPDSDNAIRILLREDIEGISQSALAEAGATEQAAVPLSGAVATEAPAITPATEATQQALNLDEDAIRDLQSRLLALGFDPNGIDGAIGKGTQSAVAAWQSGAGLPVTGFLDAPQLAALKSASQSALDAWLITPENRKLYDPPPPIEITKGSLNGQWSFTATCGKKSRFPGQQIKGGLNIRFGNGNGFDGTARNSQGFNGTVRGKLNGRGISGRISWGLLIGSVDFSGRIADQSLTINGRDSNGCRLTAWKG